MKRNVTKIKQLLIYLESIPNFKVEDINDCVGLFFIIHFRLNGLNLYKQSFKTECQIIDLFRQNWDDYTFNNI